MNNIFQENTQNLLNIIEAHAPIGKNGVAKSGTPAPLPDEIRQLLSSQKVVIPEIKEVTIEELFNIPAILCQRDTNKRINKNRKYLADGEHYKMETGRMFVAVRLPNGTMRLIDGNTRVANYHNEFIYCAKKSVPPRFAIPSSVVLTIYDQDTMEDAYSLYNTFDNSNAAENSTEKASGARDMLDINFKNGFLNKNCVNTLKVLANKSQIHLEKSPTEEFGVIKEFKPELEYIDAHSKFDAAKIDGAIVGNIVGILHKNRFAQGAKKDIMDFFNCVFSPTGEGAIQTPNGEKNAVMHMREEFYLSVKNRRFTHRSSAKTAFFGWFVYYLEQSKGDKIIPKVKLSDDKLKAITVRYLKP